jgi:hypothetical protein
MTKSPACAASRSASEARPPPDDGTAAEARRAGMVARAALIISCIALAVAILGMFLPI